MIVRHAVVADAPAMVAVLNEIIAIGGSTAHETPYDTAKMIDHYITPSELIACQVAELDVQVIGFQYLRWPSKHETSMPKGWAIIASFVSPAAAGKKVGQHLFRATLTDAQTAGVETIDATIRADNVAGLRYYSGLGFVDFDRLLGIPLKDGTPVDRVRKRFDL